jgi:FkbM family methyltransferase
LSKKTLFTLIAEKSPEKGFKVISYLNSLRHNTQFARNFAANFVENLVLFESQLGQDCLVDSIFEGKEAGVFVEIGVGQGKNISNTYFLEKQRNWTGILCEPAFKFHDSISLLRNAILIKEAVFDQSGLEMGFSEVVGSEELSALSDYQGVDLHDRTCTKKYVVKTVSFNDLYDEYLKGQKIDYVSVDTEGSELQILNAIDFDKIDISVISVEHNYDKNKLDKISQLLGRFGYFEVLPGVFEFDAIFMKKLEGSN